MFFVHQMAILMKDKRPQTTGTIKKNWENKRRTCINNNFFDKYDFQIITLSQNFENRTERITIQQRNELQCKHNDDFYC